MADAKVRCPSCGKKNAGQSDRCCICGSLLPDAAKRRATMMKAATEGPAFADIVDTEVGAWREYEASGDRPPKSRRPAELGEVERKTFTFKRQAH